MIGIRGIIFTPEEDYLTSLELAQICRKKDRFTTCMIVLNQLQKNLKNCEIDIKARVGLALAKCNHDDNDSLSTYVTISPKALTDNSVPLLSDEGLLSLQKL